MVAIIGQPGGVDTDPAKRDGPAQAGAPTPYIQRKIDVTFKLGTGDFGEAGQNVVTLRGLRCTATISKAMLGAQTQCSLRIWGMRFKEMQQLSTYGDRYGALRKNAVLIEAGDDIAGMTQVFTGIITNGYFDGGSQPDVAFQVEAYEASLYALKPAPPISAPGVSDVATMMGQLAQQMGVTFENHGVVAKLRDVYYPGTALQQMRRIADHAGVNATVENGVLAIWPRGNWRDTGSVPLIAPPQLKDYPTFNQLGVIISCLFRPIQLMQKVAIRSSLWAADGERNYYPYTYTYTLESEAPNGPWFTTFMASTKPL
jgi:baseplate hub protein gp41